VVRGNGTARPDVVVGVPQGKVSALPLPREASTSSGACSHVVSAASEARTVASPK